MALSVPSVGDTVAGKYRIEAVLGRGGMGVVYAARHAISERRVAVKWMEADLQGDPEALERFVREARAMGRIEHPNVVGVLDVGTEAPMAYLVMEILRGESLRALIEREKRVEPTLAVRTILPAMEGVEAAHRAGVVHRDLKPENLFVVRDASGVAATTKVLDFGISKLTETDAKQKSGSKLTKTGHVVGTPTYMSPEQVRGTLIDARTDVWSLSVILYEMLSGTTPFDGDNFGALLVAIAIEPFTPLDPSVVPPSLARVVHRGLAKDPAERWQSVMEMARALEPFAHGATFREPTRPSSAPPSDPGRASQLGAQPAKRSPASDSPKGPARLELESGATRAAPRASREPIAAPARPSASGSTPTVAPVADEDAARRRLITIAAVAIVSIVALVLVIRSIGNAARDAAMTGMSDPSALLPPTSIAPPSTVAITTTPPPISAPPPSGPPPPSIVAPPPPTSGRPHHDTVRARPTTTSEGPPPPTTGASRSGSIRREDF